MFGLDTTPFAKLINLLLFQGVWFLTILGAAAGNGWVGIVGLGIFLIIHFLTAETAAADFRLAIIAMLLGLITETLLVQLGVFNYQANFPVPGIAPAWLLVLWASFALTMNSCINWLQERYLLAAVLGAIGGALSYLGGLKLGAASTAMPMWVVLLIMAVIYALVTPGLLFLARKFALQYAIKKPGSAA